VPSRRDPLPRFVEPQLSLLVKAPPAGSDWVHELKYDGYRIHARIERGKTRLLTRTGLDWTERYDSTAKALMALAAEAVYLDGELCALRPDGTTTFAELQAATDSRRTTSLVYFVFDFLHVGGENLTARSLLERKQRLKELLDHAPLSIRYSDHHIGDGQRFLDAACAAKAEGIVSKRIDAPYVAVTTTWNRIRVAKQRLARNSDETRACALNPRRHILTGFNIPLRLGHRHDVLGSNIADLDARCRAKPASSYRWLRSEVRSVLD